MEVKVKYFLIYLAEISVQIFMKIFASTRTYNRAISLGRPEERCKEVKSK